MSTHNTYGQQQCQHSRQLSCDWERFKSASGSLSWSICGTASAGLGDSQSNVGSCGPGASGCYAYAAYKVKHQIQIKGKFNKELYQMRNNTSVRRYTKVCRTACEGAEDLPMKKQGGFSSNEENSLLALAGYNRKGKALPFGGPLG